MGNLLFIMVHYLIAVNYSNKENPPSYTAVMSPYYTHENLNIEDKKALYKILSAKIEKFINDKDYKDKNLYKEIRIFKIVELKKENIVEEVFINTENTNVQIDEVTLNEVNYKYYELLMAFKDYDAYIEFGKTV